MKILPNPTAPGLLSRLRKKLASLSSVEPLPPHPNLPRLHNFLLRSAILPDDRVLTLYLPEAYDSDPHRHFPVFYLHDGQNLIDPQTSYVPGRTWRVAETADASAASGAAAPVILVGIANTGLRRMAEYTPTRDFRMAGGEGHLYGRLIREEVKTFVDQNFRTLPGPASTGLGGSSLGGLISLYLGLQHADIFGNLAVMSPSIWWDHRSILTFLSHASPVPPQRIWLDIGTGEGARHVRDTELLYRMLIARGWQPDHDLAFLKVEGGTHDEDAWAARFHQVLAFLFPPFQG